MVGKEKSALPMNGNAGLRPGSMSRILKRAGSETGAPIARFGGSMREFLRGALIVILILILAFFFAARARMRMNREDDFRGISPVPTHFQNTPNFEKHALDRNGRIQYSVFKE
jgi:hypothetical protein